MRSSVLALAFCWAFACVIPWIAVAQHQAQGSANAVLNGPLDAKKAKPGDPVTVKTTEPTDTPDGFRLSKGTTLVGRVTEVKAASSNEVQSVLAFTFDRAVLKDGREVPIQAKVRALAAAEGIADPASSGHSGGINARGMLTSESQGVFGMKDVRLSQNATASAAVVTSAGRNVRLDSGTRMLLTVE
jgi:hypothetical protein